MAALVATQFKLTKIFGFSQSKITFQGTLNGYEAKDRFDVAIISTDYSGPFAVTAQKIQDKLSTMPCFQHLGENLYLWGIELGTKGKGIEKVDIFIFHCTNSHGPDKNKVTSGELTREGLPGGVEKLLEEMSDQCGEIIERDRSQEEEEATQGRLGDGDAEEFDEDHGE